LLLYHHALEPVLVFLHWLLCIYREPRVQTGSLDLAELRRIPRSTFVSTLNILFTSDREQDFRG